MTDRPDDRQPDSEPPDAEGDGQAHGAEGDGQAHGADVPTAQERRGRGVTARVVQVVAALCLAAGVTLFVTARTTASPQPASRPSTASTHGPVVDPRALLSNPDLAQSYVAAALSEIVIVSNSDYRNLDDALSAGLSVTTGGFQTRFRAALTGASAQQRRANHSTTSIDVRQVGIGQISDDGQQGKVLVFGRLHQTGDDVEAGGVDSPVTLCLTMQRHGKQILISDLQQDANAGLPPGTTGLMAAAEAARAEVVNTLTYSRANFATDLTRSQAGATGKLATELSAGAAAVHQRLNQGNYDLSGTVTAVAVQQVAGQTAVILIAATGTHVSDAGKPSDSTSFRYVVDVQRASGTWLVTSIDPVSGS